MGFTFIRGILRKKRRRGYKGNRRDEPAMLSGFLSPTPTFSRDLSDLLSILFTLASILSTLASILVRASTIELNADIDFPDPDRVLDDLCR